MSRPRKRRTAAELLAERIATEKPEDRSWNQGIEEMAGIFREPRYDNRTCTTCGHTRTIRRRPMFRPDGGIAYLPGEDPGCPKCALENIRPEEWVGAV